MNRTDTGETTFVNPHFSEVYGWPVEDLADVDQFFENVSPDPDYREEIRTRVMADIASGDPTGMVWSEITITTKSGENRIISAVNIPVPEQGLMISTVQDITQADYASALLKRGKDDL